MAKGPRDEFGPWLFMDEQGQAINAQQRWLTEGAPSATDSALGGFTRFAGMGHGNDIALSATRDFGPASAAGATGTLELTGGMGGGAGWGIGPLPKA